MKIAEYIMQLKDAGGYSWNMISEMSGVPISTIRSIASGSVEQPSYQVVCDIITAMGGSLDVMYTTPKIKKEMQQVRQAEEDGTEELKITIRTMRGIRTEMLENQRMSYETQISQLKESYEREVMHLTKSNATLRKTLYFGLAAIIIILVAIICILIYDITHLDRGWVQAFFDTSSRIVGAAQALFRHMFRL